MNKEIVSISLIFIWFFIVLYFGYILYKMAKEIEEANIKKGIRLCEKNSR